jgi:hypothetical protein
VPLAQISLEHSRRLHPDQNEFRKAFSAAAIFERAPQFSLKVIRFELSDQERRVLSLVDGDASIEQIAARAGLEADEVARVLYRLCDVELVAPQHDRALEDPHRPVLLCDPDVEAFERPLRRLFAERADPLPLVAVKADEIGAMVARQRPRMVIVNATVLGAEAKKVVQAARSVAGLDDVSLVAVMETPTDALAEQLATEGFDEVLAKPLLFSDLERLFVA